MQNLNRFWDANDAKYKPYQLIHEVTQKKQEFQAVAFNKEQTIMAAGGRNHLVLFHFNDGLLRKKQLIFSGPEMISSIYFMTLDNKIVIGTYEGSLGIWQENQITKLWQIQQPLKAVHKSWITRVIMNKKEDLIITCSWDSTIKFWINRNQWELDQTLELEDQVQSISLNRSCTQLASCGRGFNVLISEKGYDQKWKVIQKIECEQVLTISFIEDSFIAFQQKYEEEMSFYHLDRRKKKFSQFKNIPIEIGVNYYEIFPMIYNRKAQCIFNKIGSTIYVIKSYYDDFDVRYAIQLDTPNFIGAITDDCEYLVTYLIQKRKFQVWNLR